MTYLQIEGGCLDNIFLSSPQKHKLWVLIRSVLEDFYFTQQKCLGKALLISTTNICFHREIRKISVCFSCKNVPYLGLCWWSRSWEVTLSKQFCLTSEGGSILKGKNLLQLGAYFFISVQALFPWKGASEQESNIMKTCLFKYTENFTTKKWKFSDKNSDIFHTSTQNIECGYLLELPWRSCSKKYPQSMFLSRNFYILLYKKWGLRESTLYKHVFVMSRKSEKMSPLLIAGGKSTKRIQVTYFYYKYCKD